jgi:hypothetical protein
MKVSPLSTAECKEFISKIVSEFGNGRTKVGQPIFDAITRVPFGFTEKRLSTRELMSRLERYADVLLLFDPNPQNTPYRLELLHSVGFSEDLPGLKVATVDLPRFFDHKDCDFYVLGPGGPLIAVASHEDEIRGNERIMWCPVPLEPPA